MCRHTAGNDRRSYLVDDDEIDTEKDRDGSCVLLKVGDTVDSDCVRTPSVPHNLMDPASNKKWSEPDFDEVNNPGGWSSYSFKPMFEQ
eukprot:6662793-Ditylum_brightwellii.AAC.1